METSEIEVADRLLELGRALMGITLRSVAAAPVPLTVPQHRVLLLISSDGPRRVGVLAADLGVNQSSASRLVDRLVAQGLVQRTNDPADGRASRVALSGLGEEVLRSVHERRLAAVLAVVGAMASDARPQVASLLAEVTAAMTAVEATRQH